MQASKQAIWEEKLCYDMRLWRQLSVECRHSAICD